MTPIYLSNMKWKLYHLLGINKVALRIVYMFYPKTKGNTLAEIALVFGKG